MGMEEVM